MHTHTPARTHTHTHTHSLSLSLYQQCGNVGNGVYRQIPLSVEDTFQDLPQLRETADNTEHYI